jgi:hypothetical protein
MADIHNCGTGYVARIVVFAFAASCISGDKPVVDTRTNSGAASPADPVAQRLVWTQVPVGDNQKPLQMLTSGAVEEAIPLGSRIVLFGPAKQGDGVVNITPDFAAAARPDLSFDAKHILFIGKRSEGDSFGVWEMNVDGSAPRKVTDGMGGCAEAIYLSTIYTLDADRPVHQIAFRDRSGSGQGNSLYTCRMDGTRIRRITFAPEGVAGPLQLSDGRLLFSQWSSRTRRLPSPASVRSPRAEHGSALLTCHADGTDLFPFAGVHEPPALRGMACETEDGSVVYVEADGASRVDGGALIEVARTRSLHTRRVLTNDSDGFYYSPSPGPDGQLLVSHRPKQGGSYGLYLLDARTGTRGERVYDAPGWHDIDALAIRPRREPAGRSSVVDDKADRGELYGLDVYISDTVAGTKIERGQVKRLRVIKALGNAEVGSPAGSGEEAEGTLRNGGTTLGEEVLGDTLVEPDGSFFLEVPPRTPLRLETLDAQGQVLQSMQSWLWVMPGERRGCIGCHEDRELTPPNRHVQALRKDAVPVGVVPRKRPSPYDDTHLRKGYP